MAKILILAAVAQVFALAIIAKVMQQTEAVNLIAQKAALVNVLRDIEKVFSQPSGCLNALQTASIENSRLIDPQYRVALSRILEPGITPRPVAVVGQAPYGMNERTRIESLELSRFARVATDVFEADLTLTAKIHKETFSGHPIRIRLELDSSRIKTCYLASAADTESIGACRIVESSTSNGTPARAECRPAERRVSGGGACPDGVMTSSEPLETGWTVGCHSRSDTIRAKATAFAYCCVF